MRQLTIRGFDEDLAREIRQLAAKEGISLNKAVLRLLRLGVGNSEPDARDVIGSSLDHLAGTWGDEDVRELEDVEQDFERIDALAWVDLRSL